MNEMSLEEQIRCMQEMRSYLEDLSKIMLETMETLQSDIKYLRSVGFSVETEETYQQGYYIPANSKVEEVVGDIRQYHFDYIDRVIEQLEKALNRK